MLDRFRLPPGFTPRDVRAPCGSGRWCGRSTVDVVGDIGAMLWVLLGTVGIVLLVACANVANLFLVRAEGRQQELAVRMALGAGTRRVARELLAESMLLGLFAGALGVGLAYARHSAARLPAAGAPAAAGRDHARSDRARLHAGAVAAAGLLFGVIPVLEVRAPAAGQRAKENGRGSSDGRERHRARNTLVVAQVALAVVLLVASGLMVRTFVAMRDVSPGFVRPEEVLTLRISIPQRRDRRCREQVARTHEQIPRRIEAIGGVDLRRAVLVGHDGRRQQQRSDLRRGLPQPDGQIPPLRRFKWIGEQLLRDDGQPDHRRPRDHVDRRLQPARRS